MRKCFVYTVLLIQVNLNLSCRQQHSKHASSHCKRLQDLQAAALQCHALLLGTGLVSAPQPFPDDGSKLLAFHDDLHTSMLAMIAQLATWLQVTGRRAVPSDDDVCKCIAQAAPAILTPACWAEWC